MSRRELILSFAWANAAIENQNITRQMVDDVADAAELDAEIAFMEFLTGLFEE